MSTTKSLKSSSVRGHTCHTSNNSRCFNDVATLHALCGNNPSFPVASSYQRNVSRPASPTQFITANCMFIPFSIYTNKCLAHFKADLTCTGRIALQQPSLQKVWALCLTRSAVSGSRSSGIFVCGPHRCRVSVSSLSGRKKDGQLFSLSNWNK